MRSENEVIHYRARFNVTSSRDGVDPFHAITALMLGWFTKKEEQLSRRNAGIVAKLRNLNAEMVRESFLTGNLELPAGYDGGIGTWGRSSACTRGIADEDGAPQSWAFEYDEPDSKEQFRHWHTSVGLSRQDESEGLILNIRITYYMMPGFIGRPPSMPPSTTPRFVREIIESDDWTVLVGDTEVLHEECYLDLDNFGAFRESLLSPTRVLPLVLITTDANGATAVWDASELALKVLGMANVYVFDWRDRNLKERTLFALFRKWTPAYRYGCASATLRIYQPGVDLSNEEASTRHRFFKKDWIDEQRYGDRDGFVETLSRSLSRGFTTDEKDVVDIQDIERKRSEQRLKELRTKMHDLQSRVDRARDERQNHEPAKDLQCEIAYLRGQVASMQQECEEWQKLAIDYSSQDSSSALEAMRAQRDALEKELRDTKDQIAASDYRIDDLQSTCDELRSRCRGLTEGMKAIGQIEHVPTSLADVLNLVRDLWPDKVVVLDEALKSAKTFEGDLDEEWQILSSIPNVLWAIYFDSSEQGSIADQYRYATGYELALTETKLTKDNNSIMRERSRRYRGEEIDIRPHIKGKNKNPKLAFRVHYYVDRERKLIVIGHCGGHLTTSGTQRIK